jgi:hypothetical protein
MPDTLISHDRLYDRIDDIKDGYIAFIVISESLIGGGRGSIAGYDDALAVLLMQKKVCDV